jgi:hypothetical protein
MRPLSVQLSLHNYRVARPRVVQDLVEGRRSRERCANVIQWDIVTADCRDHLRLTLSPMLQISNNETVAIRVRCPALRVKSKSLPRRDVH